MKFEEEVKRLVRILQHAKWVVDTKESEFLKHADEYDALANVNTLEASLIRKNILKLAPNDSDYDNLYFAYEELRKQLNKHDYYNVCKNNGLWSQ